MGRRFCWGSRLDCLYRWLRMGQPSTFSIEEGRHTVSKQLKSRRVATSKDTTSVQTGQLFIVRKGKKAKVYLEECSSMLSTLLTDYIRLVNA